MLSLKMKYCLRFRRQISLLMLTVFKQKPPNISKKPMIFWWFQGEQMLEAQFGNDP